MKRKLDENDVPAVQVAEQQPDASTSINQSTFSSPTESFKSFNLDPRLIQAVAKAGFSKPTPVQQQVIPLALQAKDILAKSKTGSGKTLTYVLPTLHALLQQKKSNPNEKVTRVLVLVPTRELAEQVHKSYQLFSAFCAKEVKSVNLTQRVSDAVLGAIVQDAPDIIVSTPGRVCEQLTTGNLLLSNITTLVIDEADILLSYGYEENMNTIHAAIPRGIQTFLISATLSPEVETLQAIFCNHPTTITIDEKDEKGPGISQYVVKCGEDEKFLLLFVIFKLKLIKGKCIIFAEDVDRCYRLKLFLEQFGIKSCVLNSELPVNSRIHAVEEFNKGLYEILIASDDQEVIGGVVKRRSSNSKSENTGDSDDDEDDNEEEEEDEEKQDKNKAITDNNEKNTKVKQANNKLRLPKNKDFGISRGIDFQNVSCVLNFDLPPTSRSYTHRIGRTGRASKAGMALSFVVPRDLYKKHPPTSIRSGKSNEKTLSKITRHQLSKGQELKPYHFDMTQVDGFRYRMNDALRAVTRVAVHETCAREIKQELVKTEKLHKHFEENPDDLRHLRHDVEHGVVRVQPHLKHIPEYLIPKMARNNKSASNGDADTAGFVGFNKEDGDKRDRKRRRTEKSGNGRGKFRGQSRPGSRKIDPLKSFGARRK